MCSLPPTIIANGNLFWEGLYEDSILENSTQTAIADDAGRGPGSGRVRSCYQFDCHCRSRELDRFGAPYHWRIQHHRHKSIAQEENWPCECSAGRLLTINTGTELRRFLLCLIVPSVLSRISGIIQLCPCPLPLRVALPSLWSKPVCPRSRLRLRLGRSKE